MCAPEETFVLRVAKESSGSSVVEEPINQSPLEYSYSEYDPVEVEKELVDHGTPVKIMIRREKLSTERQIHRSVLRRGSAEPVIVDVVLVPVEQKLSFVKREFQIKLAKKKLLRNQL